MTVRIPTKNTTPWNAGVDVVTLIPDEYDLSMDRFTSIIGDMIELTLRLIH
jgi:hypothetical protein